MGTAGSRTALLLLSTVIAGCFSTSRITPEGLRRLEGPTAVRISLKAGGVVRGLVGPADAGPRSLRYLPLKHGPGSWVVRFGGWPLVYTAGKVLRFETAGGAEEVSLAEVAMLHREDYDWGLTLATLPLTLPLAAIDFLVHHARFGFDEVDVGFDSFSRPTGARRKTG